MLIRTTLIAATAAIGLTGPVIADGSKAPTILDDQALDGVIAGYTLNVKNYGTESLTQVVGVPPSYLPDALSSAFIQQDCGFAMSPPSGLNFYYIIVALTC